MQRANDLYQQGELWVYESPFQQTQQEGGPASIAGADRTLNDSMMLTRRSGVDGNSPIRDRMAFNVSLARSSYIRQSIVAVRNHYDDTIVKQLRTKLDNLELYGEIKCIHPTEYFMIQQPVNPDADKIIRSDTML